MSARKAEALALEQIIRESKEGLLPPEATPEQRDRLETALMDRVAEDAKAEAVACTPASGRVWTGIAAALAVAASVAALLGRAPSRLDPWGEPQRAAEEPAGTLASGEGTVKVRGAVVKNGYVLRAGDAIDVPSARATFERSWSANGAHAHVAWSLEGASAAVVEHAGSSLVVGLERGAVEAQVLPVATGEAFAVDVSAGDAVVRVAVHGTHLRVARAGAKVTIDLSEGVVSIGPAPRFGSTYGTLVTAPAHVELDASNLAAGVLVDHAPRSVRAPAVLAPPRPAAQARNADLSPPTPAAAQRSAPLHAKDHAPSAALSATDATDATDAPDPHAAETIAAAIRACASPPASARSDSGGSGEVKVTVTSSLELHVGAGGIVELARFDPPLRPELQTCAFAAIHKTKFAAPGVVTIPVELSR